MSKSRRLVKLEVWIPVDLEEGKTGLHYITSPMVNGLLVAAQSEAAALGKVSDAINDLAHAHLS